MIPMHRTSGPPRGPVNGLRLFRQGAMGVLLVMGASGSLLVRASAEPILVAGRGTATPGAPAPAGMHLTAPAPHGAGKRRGFEISGGVTGLFPGATRPVELTLTNRESLPITVVSVTTTVGNASARCSAAYVSVSAFSGHLTVAGDSSANLTVSASMAHSAPDSCQAAVFPFRYAGEATSP